MSRGKKLLIVGLVLCLGVVLAWPFRKTGGDLHESNVAAALVSEPQPRVVQPPTAPFTGLSSAAPHVVAKMTSTGQGGDESPSQPQRSASFDLANHPALSGSMVGSGKHSPVTPPIPPQQQQQPVTNQSVVVRQPAPTEQAATAGAGSSRPAYETVDSRTPAPAPAIREVRHVVQSNDTLEKLAKRYLGDEGRALEIFDLNRDVLDNPHLLPIEAELRIPASNKQLH